MFEYDDVTTHTLKGLADAVWVYWVRGASAAESRFEAATATGLTPLVGRDGELDLLLRRWEQAREGEGQVVLLAGEAGIGKSRITQALRQRLSDEPYLRLRAQCLPYYSNSAFYPFIAHLERAMACERDAPPAEKLAALEALLARAGPPLEEVVPLLAALLSIPTGDRYAPLTLSPQRQKDKTIEALIDQVRGLAQQQPVLYIFEDIHWIDPTSLEALTLLIDRLPDTRVLLVITYRPEFIPPWDSFTHVTTHTLNRLSRRQVATMVQQITGGRTLPQEVLDQIVTRTDGVPLFVEELTKTVLESGLLRDDGERYTLAGPLPALAIPDTLQGSLLARLDRLGSVKEVAQLGAVLGREFSYELLAAVSPLPDAELQEVLYRLVQAELVFCRGQPPEATYLFKHVLVQDSAYNSLLRSTRRQLHTKIATVMQERFPSLAEAEPELVAHHYTEAGLNEHAIVYWQRAGQRAVQRSANVEAIAHLTKGLKLLETLPESPERTQQELTLQLTLGAPLTAAEGYGAPAVAQAFGRARELCQQIGETPQLFPALRGLSLFCSIRGEWQTGRELGEQLMRLAQRVQDPTLLLEAHRILAALLFWLGELALVQEHTAQALALYDPAQHRSLAVRYGQDPGVMCLTYVAWVRWLLGYPDQAREKSRQALTLAQELGHPNSLGIALTLAATLTQFQRAGSMVQNQAEATITLSTEHGFPLWIAWGTILQGWTLAEQGQGEKGISQIQQGLAAWRAGGNVAFQPYFLALLAEAYDKVGQAGEGLRVLAEALEVVYSHGEIVWEAELHRLKGQLLLRQAVADDR
jgi:predicted ATPase